LLTRQLALFVRRHATDKQSIKLKFHYFDLQWACYTSCCATCCSTNRS